jgi:hypothetical protein
MTCMQVAEMGGMGGLGPRRKQGWAVTRNVTYDVMTS